MEINKLTFDKLANSKGIEYSFEDLDINNDGKINNTDLNSVSDNSIKNAINTILFSNDIDDEPELELSTKTAKTGAKSSKKSEKSASLANVTELTNRNADTILNNSEGVTYIIVDNNNCSRCKEFESKVLPDLVEAYQGQASFAMLNCDNTGNLLWKLASQVGYDKELIGLPAVIKCVNGVPQDVVSYKRSALDSVEHFQSYFEETLPELNKFEETTTYLTKENVDENLTNTSGVSFVFLNNDKLEAAKEFLADACAEISGKINIYSVERETDENGRTLSDSLYRKLLTSAQAIDSYEGTDTPVMIKYVNGEPVEIITQKDLDNNKDNMTEYLKSVANDNAQQNIPLLTSENVEEKLYNTEGTSFVYVTGNGCSICNSVKPTLINAKNELGDNANILQVNTSVDKTLFWKLLRDAGYTEDTAPIPMMIKYVDGQPVEIMSRQDLTSHKKDNTLTEYLSAKIDKPYVSKSNDKNNIYIDFDNTEETNANDNEVQNGETTQEEETQSNYIADITQNISQHITTNRIKNAIESATSISELRDIVTDNAAKIDIDTLTNLRNTVNSFNFPDDELSDEETETTLAKAKETLIALL